MLPGELGFTPADGAREPLYRIKAALDAQSIRAYGRLELPEKFGKTDGDFEEAVVDALRGDGDEEAIGERAGRAAETGH